MGYVTDMWHLSRTDTTTKVPWGDLISINQISIALISPAMPGSVARQPHQCLTMKSMQLRSINGPSGRAGVYVGKARSKRGVFRCFVKVATEMAERRDSGRLFQRGARKWKYLYNRIGLDPRDKQTNNCLNSGMVVMHQAWSEDKYEAYSRSATDLELHSKFYW